MDVEFVIQRAIDDDPEIKLGEIAVQVKKPGVFKKKAIYLTGIAGTGSAKARAETIAKAHAAGMKVESQIVIQQSR